MIVDTTSSDALPGFERVFVWVGCMKSAERACELAGVFALARSGEVTLGLVDRPLNGAIERLVTPLIRQGISVRLYPLPDRGVPTMLAALQGRRSELLLHADREAYATPSPALLSRICPCPVWTFRTPAERWPDQSGLPRAKAA